MTVGELIEELKKCPRDKIVQLGTLTIACGVAARVIEYEESVEIESDED